MAAPTIPDLRSLRGRTGLRGRGRGRGLGTDMGFDESEEDKATARDKIIQQTDGDASSSRMSAVALGYLDDPYARSFTQGQIAKRYPIINRGTFVRTTAIDRLVDSFLATDPQAKKQIVSLGAGSDTRFFRLKDTSNLIYHELDFPTNTIQKITTIERTPALLNTIRSRLDSPENLAINPEKTALTSQIYNIHPLDLRSLSTSTSDNPASPHIPNLDPKLPTLLLSECCLCYLDPSTTTSILSTLTTNLLHPSTPVSLVLYEPIRPYDSFGRTMISNLGSRGIHMQTLKKYHSLRAQRERLRFAGFVDGQGARDVEGIYYGQGEAEEWISKGERQRIDGLEWLDEVEEWRLLARHYCVAWGWRDGGVDGSKGLFSRAWEGVGGGWSAGERADDEIA